MPRPSSSHQVRRKAIAALEAAIQQALAAGDHAAAGAFSIRLEQFARRLEHEADERRNRLADKRLGINPIAPAQSSGAPSTQPPGLKVGKTPGG
jgi:hypothetical protein